MNPLIVGLRTAARNSAVATILGGSLALLGFNTAQAAEEVVSYALDVQPILQSRCASCHTPGGEGYKISGLDMSSYETLMRGTKHGPIVIPGDPLRSNLLVLVEGRADPSMRMPHNQRPLLKQQIDILRLWIKEGAKDN